MMLRVSSAATIEGSFSLPLPLTLSGSLLVDARGLSGRALASSDSSGSGLAALAVLGAASAFLPFSEPG